MNARPARLLAANRALQVAGAWPNPSQTLLLRAALGQEPAEVLAAWDEWRNSVDFENLDYGSHRLLPLLHRNLLAHGAAPHPWLGRMKGLHRHTWVRNQRLLAGAAGLIQVLREKLGLEVMLLKGAAFISKIYPDMGLRPMDDFDFLVRPEHAAQSVVLLGQLGWRPVAGWATTGKPLEQMSSRWRKFTHAQNFILDDNGAAPEGIGVDLHWRALADAGTNPELNERLWMRAHAVTLPCGTPAFAPDPTDLLCQTCLHGLRFNPIPPVRWAADAAMLLRQSDGGIDWPRLQRFAIENAFARRLGAALAYLADNFHLPVPPATLSQFRAAALSPEEEAEFRFLVEGERPMDVGIGGRLAYRLHRRRSPGLAIGWQEAADYFCHRWRVASPLGLPAGSVRHAIKRVSQLVRWKLRTLS